MSLNTVMLIGNLGKDPESRFTQTQIQVATFPVATTEKVKNREGQYQDKTEWHNITVFGKTAENCVRYLKKGSKAYIEGKLRTEQYEKNGEKRFITKVIASKVIFLDSKNQGGSNQDQVQQEPNPWDDVPF